MNTHTKVVMAKKPKPCADCGRLPKMLPRHFCQWCQLKREPMHIQAEAAKRRLEAVPEHLRLKRSHKVVKEDTLEGTEFCAGCQSFCPEWMFSKSGTQCKPCMSLKGHESRVKRAYGIDSAEYERIVAAQGGVCAISGAEFKRVRGVVDHDHKTGSVRGVLNSKVNHELLGTAHDDPDMLWRAYVYLKHPPASSGLKRWDEIFESNPPPEIKEPRSAPTIARRDSPFSQPLRPVRAKKAEGEAPPPPPADKCERGLHYLPTGSESVPGRKGAYRLYWEEGSPPPF